MLAVVGDLLEDIVVRIDAPPAKGTDTPATIVRRRGGSAANVAASAARAGGEVRFIGCVGDDALGASLLSELSSAGVDVRVQRRGRTGAVVVLVDPGGERTMMPDRGASTELAAVDPTWLDGVTWLHVPSYSLLSEPIGTAAASMMAAVRAAGGRTSIDVSSVAIVESFGLDRYHALLARLAPDVVFANAPESALLPAAGRWTAIVKNGQGPVRAIAPGTAFEVGVQRLDDVVDTTGAGDAFAAGFTVAADAGASIRESVIAGIAAAAALLRT